VTLDSWLVARLAAELQSSVGGNRVSRVSGSASGIDLHCYGRGKAMTLAASVDSESPVMAAIDAGGETDAKRAHDENGAGGWAGGVAPLLRGCIIEAVHAVPNDRIIYVDLISRSSFGVPSRHRLAVELLAPAANAFVLRALAGGRWQILAACKKTRPSPGRRGVEAGESYEPPQARTALLDAQSFASIVDSAEDIDPRTLLRALGDLDPACTPPLAREVIARTLAMGGDGAIAARLLQTWHVVRDEAEAALADEASVVHVWRDRGVVNALHLVHLTWPRGDESTASSLNAVCAEQIATGARKRLAPKAGALRKRLATLLARGEEQRKELVAARERAEASDELQHAGESIFAYLAQIPPGAASFVTPEGLRIRLDPSKTAKENAADYFKRLKKARGALPHVVSRLAQLGANRAYWEELLWQIERAESAGALALQETCSQVERALGLGRTEEKTSGRAGKTRARSAAAGERSVAISGGATAYVGRSPKDNERVTFTLASPGDYWFHARNMPGAHVVLKLAGEKGVPSPQQIEEAAALAAGQSRAAGASKVEVDYTQRKHVRRQGGGRVGAVYYTHARTVAVAPRKLEI
jgi:predicted ribosome quality control (RQC) complex YloA/Tae2 family protein